MNIEIEVLMQEMEDLKSKIYDKEIREKLLEKELYKIRDFMLDLSVKYNTIKIAEIQKMSQDGIKYKGTASEFNDPEKGAVIR